MDIFGSDYRIQRVVNRHGGAQKVVYKIECTNGFVCMLYIWDMASNYFQEEIEAEPEDERSFGSGRFEANHAFLCQHGIRTPALYYLNKERHRYAFDYAVVEYVDGQDAAHYLNSDAETYQIVFERIGSMLGHMHGLESPTYGRIQDKGRSNDCCYLKELADAKLSLSYAAAYISEIETKQEKLLNQLNELAARIGSRQRYSFIHGELGPDHVMVNEKLEPYVIDIEGCLFYDLEYEHSFLEFRFGDAYAYLRSSRLDHNRMLFYKMFHHLSCTEGGLKLLHRGFPNQQLAREIVEHNYRSALTFIDRSL
ncbi:phosphotransferase [Paenibacillus luteus]|uniref:phosphotransferase n=1 Tax=Paenibacillus luteus TaxID=2545753 RepID=UPI001144F629|nr:phosphotransferase [Paenibacillus luteus]